MVLLDPFYGVSDAGVKITRWMNRVLLVAELSAVAYGVYKFHEFSGKYPIFILAPVLVIIAIHLANTVVRWFWNIVMVVIYGTTDIEVISESYDRKQQKRRQKALMAEAAERAKLEAAQNRTPLRISGGKVDYGPDCDVQDPPKCITDTFL